jgi:predicted RNase H-like nuclease
MADVTFFDKLNFIGGARYDYLDMESEVLPDSLDDPGLKADVDDMLDAGAAAWTARRVARGEARTLPDPPETFSDGLSCAIWI